MAKSQSGRQLTGKTKMSRMGARAATGQATVAEKNRQRETRLRVIEALIRLDISYDRWPNFVREYHAEPGQRTEYQQLTFPSPFQAPALDRLNQSPEDWAKFADRAWKLHRNKFIQQCEDWVKAGVDEEIEWKATRGPGSQPAAPTSRPKRGANAPFERRYDWAAQYLAQIPLKEIAGEHANSSTVGRIARAIVRSADWDPKSRLNKVVPHTITHQEFPKYKYHRSEPVRIVRDREEELALGDGWENTPPAPSK
jgi:hypothetical protein